MGSKSRGVARHFAGIGVPRLGYGRASVQPAPILAAASSFGIKWCRQHRPSSNSEPRETASGRIWGDSPFELGAQLSAPSDRSSIEHYLGVGHPDRPKRTPVTEPQKNLSTFGARILGSLAGGPLLPLEEQRCASEHPRAEVQPRPLRRVGHRGGMPLDTSIAACSGLAWRLSGRAVGRSVRQAVVRTGCRPDGLVLGRLVRGVPWPARSLTGHPLARTQALRARI